MPLTRATSPERAILSQALRAIRRRRGLRVKDVALAMGLPLRTYQNFEAGRTELDYGRIQAFARVTDSDPNAILMAVMLGSPGFALHTLENKLTGALLIGLRRFDERMGERMARIEVGRLIAAFRRAFDDLEAEANARDDQAAAWFRDPPTRGS